jgi:hypothetical protein
VVISSVAISFVSCYVFIMSIEDIALLCKNRSLRWTSHILKRIFQRGIRMDDVENALTNGEIIEQYPSDYPFPSCLVLGILRQDCRYTWFAVQTGWNCGL